MPRRNSTGFGGLIFHALNRGVRRLRLFDHDGDYASFIRCLAEAQVRVRVEIFAFCLMPNHFHLILRPQKDPDLAEFMRLATVTHSKRWHQYRGSSGTGAVYQGRYKAFPIQTDRYFLAACRYVEANPVRAKLVDNAADWRWSSFAEGRKNCHILKLSPWPILPPSNWADVVNAHADSEELRKSVRRSIPLGETEWALTTARRLQLDRGLRRPGRPAKVKTQTTPGVIS